MKAVLDAEQTSLGRLITVGHGTLELAALCQLLTGAGVELLVDVRRFPASRRLPHLSSAALQPALEEAGLAYRWEERLGGRRRLPKPDPRRTRGGRSRPSGPMPPTPALRRSRQRLRS